MKAIPLFPSVRIRKVFWTLCVSLALGLTLTACGGKDPVGPDPDPEPEPEPEIPTLSLDQESLSFSQTGGTQTVQVRSNTDWVAAAFGEGFSVSPSGGSKDGTLTITAAPASSPEARTGSVSVRAGASLAKTVDLTQSAKSVITVTSGAADFGPEGGDLQVKVEYNVEYTAQISEGASWLTLVETKALNSQTLLFAVAPNEGYDDRSATITVKDKGGVVEDQVVTVNQGRKAGLLLDIHAVEAPHSGHSFEVEVQYSHDYTVEVLDNWIQQVETKGLNTQRVGFTVADNASAQERTGRVAFASPTGNLHDTVTVVQGGKYFEVLSLSATTSLSEAGGEFSLNVKHNVAYSYQVDEAAASWLSLKDQSTQEDTDCLTFVAAPNTTYEAREGVLTLTEESGVFDPVTIPFSQIQEYVLHVTSNKQFEAPYDGMTFDVTLEYSTPYDVVIAPEDYWIRPVETKALGGGTLTFAVAETTSDMQREGRVIFRTRLGQAADTVQVVQAPGESQRKTLIAIYRALGGASWASGMNAGWDSLDPIAEWAGVTVEDGKITGLELPAANLVGALPAEVSQLQNLKVLDLSGNPNLTGPLPQGLGDFALLERLLLQDCGFTGTLETLTASATRPLRVIRLEHNALTGTLPQHLLARLPQLDTLWLAGNALTGDLPALQEMKDTGRPRSFCLEGNNLSGSIPEAWSTMPELSASFDLRLEQNRLTGEIPYTLQKHPNFALWNVAEHFFPQQNGVTLTLQRVIPVVGETAVSHILATTARVRAAVSDNGGVDPTAYGFEVNGKDVSATLQEGEFEAALTNLPADTEVEVRAWARNEAGTGYGPMARFTTAGLPSLSEVTVTALGAEEATLTARITGDGRDPQITASGFVIDGRNQNVTPTADGQLTYRLTGLRVGSQHTAQAFATNSAGRQVGAQVSFTTIDYPAVQTLAATEVGMHSALLHGQVSSTGGGSIVERGFYFNGTKYPVALDRPDFSLEVSGLSSNIPYSYSAYVVNEAGQAEGSELSFRTLQGANLSGVVSVGANYPSGAVITLERMDASWAAPAPASVPATKAPVHEAQLSPLTAEDLARNLPLVQKMLAQASRTKAPAGLRTQSMSIQTTSNEEGTYSCTTQTGGTYQLRDIVPGLYGVRITASGCVPFFTQVNLRQGENSVNFDGLKSADGGQVVQWYNTQNVATRPFTLLAAQEPLMATVTWAPQDLGQYVGKAISKLVFYPTEATSFFVLMVNDETIVTKLTELINKYQDKIDEISAGGQIDASLVAELLPLITNYGKYLMMINPEDVRAGCTNVLSYSSMGGADAKVDVKSGQIFSLIMAGVSSGNGGLLMTDGAGPAVNNKGNVVMMASNPAVANLSQVGYQGNWHIGMCLK